MKKIISIVCIIVFFLGIAVFFVSWGKSQAPEEIIEPSSESGAYELYPSGSIGENCINIMISNPEPFSGSQKIFTVAPEEPGREVDGMTKKNPDKWCKNIISVKEAAELLRMTPQAVWKKMMVGKIRYKLVSPGIVARRE